MSDSTDTSAVDLTIDGDVAVVHLDDGKANALGHAVLDDLGAALDRAEAEARAVVVVGREGRFSAGFDLATMTAGPDSALPLLAKGAEVAIRLLTFPSPVVMACTGHALAMGAILLMSADVRVGAEGAFKLGMNEVAIGMPVPRFAVELARDRLSPRHFPSAIGLARVYDPAGAIEAGYLDRSVAPERVEAEAREQAATLAATLHPTAFRMTRAIVREDLAEALRRGIARDLEDFAVQS